MELCDSGLAQDAAQEAFLEAYLNLPKLREPAAFPGWFRRILIKHGDRQLRGKHLSPVPIDAAISIPAARSDPAVVVEDTQLKRAVHDAIAAPPQSQRMVTTLFYIEGYSLKEIAKFLEWPITNIKKHLYTARKRLKARMIAMLQEHLHETKPSGNDRLAHTVQFFIALKAGDLRRVKALVEQDPDLIHAQTKWGIASDGYYWPRGVTALHWAATTGDEPLLTFLLSRGADKNVKDLWGMTPLHHAVLMRQPAMVRLLLAHGADINAEDTTGFTPLHHAVLRNSLEVAKLLLVKGANVQAADKRQRTPADWAMLKGWLNLVELLVAHGAAKPAVPPAAWPGEPALHGDVRLVPVGEGVLGRVLDGTGQPIDELPPLTAVPRQPIYWPADTPTPPILETGIKIIDLLMPLKRGGHIGVFTPLLGVGKYVVLSQLVYNMAAMHSGYTVCIGVEDGAYTANNLMLVWRGWGADQTTVLVFGRSDDPASTRRQIAETGLTIAEHFRSQGHDVLLLVDSRLALTDGVLPYIRANTISTSKAAITTIYDGDYTVGAEPPLFAHLDAVLTFDQARAKQGLWPAIDPLRSRSRLLQPDLVGATHVQVATQAQRLLRRYADLHTTIENGGLDALPSAEDRQVAVRARRLHRFLTQPFPGAEPWSGTLGQTVAIEDTIEGCQALLDGQYDTLPEEAFYFVGTIDQAIEKAKRA
jgi:F-type H+/Na+-transporting ATPase subunit beta